MKIRKFQQGSSMPAVAPVETAPQEQDPILMLAELSMQALQSNDCAVAMEVCQAFVSLVEQMNGGGQPMVGEAPEASQPVFRRGGTISRRIKK